MTKQVYLFNFDGVLNQEGEFKIIESGAGLCRAGFNVGNTTLKDEFLKRLIEKFEFQVIYIVGKSGQPKELDIIQMGFTLQYCANNPKIIFITLADLIDNKQTLNPQGLIMLNPNNLPFVSDYHFASIFKHEGIDLPVVNNSMMTRLAITKPFLVDMVQQVVPDAMPKQCIVDHNNMQSSRAEREAMKTSHVILKPLDGTRAEGVMLVEKTYLENTLRWLVEHAEKIELDASDIPELGDNNQNKRLAQMITNMRSVKFNGCIVQERVAADPVIVAEKPFRPTNRIGVIAVYDTETKKLEIDIPLVIDKFPLDPLASEKLLWRENISFNATNAYAESQEDTPQSAGHIFLKTAIEQRYPASLITPTERANKIRSSILPKLEVLFKYIIATPLSEYYAKVLGSSRPIAAATKGMLPIMMHQAIDNEQCTVFKRADMNVALILLHHLQRSCEVAERLNHPAVVTKDTARLLLKYQGCFGKLTEYDQGELQQTAKIILEKYANQLEKRYKTDYLTLINEFLNMCTHGKFIHANPDVLYHQGMENFRNNKMGDAESCLRKASGLNVTDSKQQDLCLYNLATCCIRQNKFSEAAAELEEVVLIRKKLLGQGQATQTEVEKIESKLKDLRQLVAADQHARRANLFYTKKQYSAAIDSITKALAEYPQEMQGITHWCATCHFNLATYLQANGDLGSAKDEYEKCREIRRETLGVKHPSVAAVSEKIAALQTLGVPKPPGQK